MLQLVAQALVVLASALLVILAIQVVGAMRRQGHWLAFGVWSGIACAALSVGATSLALPLPAALLLATLAVLLWRQRRRIVWAAEQGLPW